MDCIDLRVVAKDKHWKWRFEESYRAEKDPEARGDGRWYVEILCKKGLIYPWGNEDLLAFTSTKGILAQLLSIGSEIRIHQHGNGEAVVRFPYTLLQKVAEVLLPRRRGGNPSGPPLEARAKGLEALKRLSKGRETDSGSTITTVDDGGDVG
jgi:hypothetical protein